MNAFARLPLFPLVLVTVVVTVPTVFAGVVAVMVVPFETETLVAATVPNLTLAPAAKFVPVIVTAVPPAIGPEFGEMPDTVGIGAE